MLWKAHTYSGFNNIFWNMTWKKLVPTCHIVLVFCGIYLADRLVLIYRTLNFLEASDLLESFSRKLEGF